MNDTTVLRDENTFIGRNDEYSIDPSQTETENGKKTYSRLAT